MGDDILTEDELLAHAIALSLEAESSAESTAANSSFRDVETSSPVELRSPNPTAQSYDSVLNEPEGSFTGSVAFQRGNSSSSSSQRQATSPRSSPDLGIAPESDVDPLSGTGRNIVNSQESLCSSPEAEQERTPRREGLNLDDRNTSSEATGKVGTTPADSRGHQLPFTRLSSLHDFGGDGSTDHNFGKRWMPDKDALELIVGMGISENAATRALYHTGNNSAEAAVSWVFENISDPSLHTPFVAPVFVPTGSAGTGGGGGDGGGERVTEGGICHSYDDFAQLVGMADFHKDGDYKMTLVVNCNLKMGVGKVAAQVGHAVLGIYHQLEREPSSGLRDWESRGAKKIVLRGRDTQHLLELKQKALDCRVANIIVHDAGKTQVDPGSLTVLALFGRSKPVDSVTGDLRLL